MRYYIESGGRALGPFASETIRDMINKETLNPNSRVSVDRIVWKKAAEFSELFGSKPTPPPPATTPPARNRQEEARPSPKPPLPSAQPSDNAPPVEQIATRSRRKKEFLNQKLSNRFFWCWLSVSIAGVLALLAALFMALSYESKSETLVLVAVWLLGVGVSFFLFAIVLALMFFHSFWRSIPKEIARVPADVAVGFLFVPLWQFYWFYVLLISGTQSMNEALEQHGLLNRRSPGVSTGVAASAAVCLTFIPFLQNAVIAALGILDSPWFIPKTIAMICLIFFPLQIVGIVLLCVVMGQMKRAAEPLNKLLDK